MTKEEASKVIAQKIAEIERLFAEAQAIADENKVHIRWSGPTYGMGGSYSPKGTSYEDEDSSWCTSSYDRDSDTGVWRSSSYGC